MLDSFSYPSFLSPSGIISLSPLFWDRLLVTRDTIVNLAKQIKANFTSKTAFSEMEQNVNSAFKSGEIVGSTINLYTAADKSGSPAFSFDFPEQLSVEDYTEQEIADLFADPDPSNSPTPESQNQ